MVGIEVQGLKELQHGFRQMNKEIDKTLRAELVVVAEPVKLRAQQLAETKIRNILSPTASVDWWQMRVGVKPGVVYVAPAQRGMRIASRRRPNLAGLLRDRAMEPAVVQSEPEIIAGIETIVDRLVEKYG